MPHCCADEVMAVVAILAFWGPAKQWIRTTWQRRHEKPCCQHDQPHKEVL